MLVGEGGIPRLDVLDRMEWWEVMRCYYGIQRRYRMLADTARQRDFLYMSAHWSKSNGPLPASACDWNPHPWDPVISQEHRKREIDEAWELLRAAQKEATEG